MLIHVLFQYIFNGFIYNTHYIIKNIFSFFRNRLISEDVI